MTRPLRLEFSGATYHVMARGNQGQKIWIDDHDREMWLATTVQALSGSEQSFSTTAG
jgi:hypothetical protein